MKRLIEKTVFWGLVTAWRLATVPTRRSPPCVNATTDGVVRPPSAFSITVGSPPSSTAIQLLVVPRSIPIVLPIVFVLLLLARENLSESVADLERRATVRSGAARGHERRGDLGCQPAVAAHDLQVHIDTRPVCVRVDVVEQERCDLLARDRGGLRCLKGLREQSVVHLR